MVINSFLGTSTRFFPLHWLQGLLTTSPSPPQRGQVVIWVKKPAERRTSPMPLHCGQRTGWVPGSAPLPEQRGQVS